MPFNLPFNFPYFPGNYRYSPLKKHQNKPEPNSKNTYIEDKTKENKKASEKDEVTEAFFEIFGLKLYFDDILIIGLLFLLYNEKVQDEELFICLILLLLT